MPICLPVSVCRFVGLSVGLCSTCFPSFLSVFVCLSVRLSVCRSVCMSVRLHLCMKSGLSVCVSVCYLSVSLSVFVSISRCISGYNARDPRVCQPLEALFLTGYRSARSICLSKCTSVCVQICVKLSVAYEEKRKK